jgi:hypothetical protein
LSTLLPEESNTDRLLKLFSSCSLYVAQTLEGLVGTVEPGAGVAETKLAWAFTSAIPVAATRRTSGSSRKNSVSAATPHHEGCNGDDYSDDTSTHSRRCDGGQIADLALKSSYLRVSRVQRVVEVDRRWFLNWKLTVR